MTQPPTPPPPGSPYGYPAPGPAVLPTHEHASLSLGLGIIGLLGGCACGVGLLVSPFALAYGLGARRAIAAEPDRWRGDDMALAGVILGAIGTVALALAVVGFVVWGALVLAGLAHTGSL